MTDDDQHDARMELGQTALAMLDAVEDSDVTECIEALVGWAITARTRLHGHGVSGPAATGWVLGAVLAGMNQE